MVLAGNKAKHLFLVNHTTKTIHHHYNRQYSSKNLQPMSHFYTPYKHQETFSFLMRSEVIELGYCLQMG